MTKTTYVATAPNGAIFTRKSERNYTHAVVYQQSYEGQLREYGKVWEVDKSNFLYAVKIVASGGTLHAREVYNEAQRAEVERHNAERLAEAKATVETYGTAAAYAEAKKNERVARLVAKLADGGFDEWFVEGFCGRFDLAQKLAGKVNGGYFAMNATIVPATIFAK